MALISHETSGVRTETLKLYANTLNSTIEYGNTVLNAGFTPSTKRTNGRPTTKDPKKGTGSAQIHSTHLCADRSWKCPYLG